VPGDERGVGNAFSQALGNPPLGGNQLAWMNAALGGGSGLGNAVADYAATVGAADFTSPLLTGRFPTRTFETIANIGAGQSATQTTTVDHLAARLYTVTATATTTLHLDWSWPGGGRTCAPRSHGSAARPGRACRCRPTPPAPTPTWRSRPGSR
jgi:hypothetical protein